MNGYSVWLWANGQNVEIDELTVNAPNGRGIKIADEDAGEKIVDLDIKNSSFTTAAKSAILVSSIAGANITTENVDILNVQADNKNIVWVDEDYADSADKVTVNDDLAFMEGTVATVNGVGYKTLALALAATSEMSGDVVIDLCTDAELSYGAREAYGSDAVTSITINGNDNTLTLNQTNSDWSSIGMKNADGVFKMNNVTVEKTGYGDTSGAWNTHAINFNVNTEFKDVTFNNSIKVSGTSVLTNVDIVEAGEYYGIWIPANATSVTINGGSITATNGGRGIKIADQYVEDSAQNVSLKVDGMTFKTAKKAAVLVSSIAGADITATNYDITEVAADSQNFAWIDDGENKDKKKYTDYAEQVTVNGGAAFVEGTVATVKGVGYTDVATAFAQAVDGDEVVIYAAGTYSVPTGKDITITGAADGVVFDNIGACGMNSSVTFNNVTFDYYPNVNYTGLQHAGDMVYNDCTINGQVFLYGTSETFNNCTFNQTSSDAYNVWTYSAGKALLIYKEGDDTSFTTSVNVVDTDFNASVAVEGKAAIEMDSSLIAGIKLTIDADTTATGFDKGNVSGNSLWNNKKGNTGANNDITVVVDGETVLKPKFSAKIGEIKYETIAEAINAAQVGETVTILAGTYAVPSMKAGITIEGEGDVLLEGTIGGTLENLTLKNLHIKGGNAQRWAYAKGNLTFENVTFEATSVYALHFDGITAGANLLYKDCTIIGWAAMSGSPASCVFDGCTIKDNGTYGVIRTYFDAEIKNCTFDVDEANTADVYQDGIHAVGATVKVNNCKNENGDIKDILNVSSNEGDRAYVYVDDALVLASSLKVEVSTKAELDAAIAAAEDGDTIKLTADIDYGNDQLKIEKPITLDLGGFTLTTANNWGGMSLKNNPTIKNGNIKHTGNTAAIKAWNVAAFEDLTIEVTTYTEGKVKGGIVLQEGSTTRVGSIKNVTIKGAGLTNGIETYNCGDATNDVIGSMENVTIDAVGTAMNISAPVGTATGCTFDGDVNGIEIWIKGNYSAKLDLVDCDVKGGVYAHDEFSSNPNIQNNGTLSLTADTSTTGASEDDITLTIARAENVEGVLEAVMNNAKAKVGDTYYDTFAAAIEAAQTGDTVTLLADVKLTGKFTVAKEITINGNGHSIIADTNGNWVKNPSAFIKQYNHLLGVNSNNVTLKNIVLDNNNNAAGINLYCAQNVVFDNVSIVNATKGMAALTVNGSTLTIKNKFVALGNSIAIDIDNGSGVTSALGVTVEDGTVFDLGDKTVKFASVATVNMSGAVTADGKPYFAAKDNAYLYTENQINSRTNTFSNGLTLLADVELTKEITVKGTLDINGKTLTIPENKELNVVSNLTVVNTAGGTINGGFNINKAEATITAEKGLDVTTNLANSAVVYANGVYSVAPAIAKIGEKLYGTLADALADAKNNDKVELIWNEGDAPIAMNGAVYGKTVTITGDATVDWSKGNLFVGRGGEGNGTVIFDNANLKSASNSASYGIHVSGREKDTTNKYDGTLIINNSTIELDYLINRGAIELDNSALTVKNGFGIAGRPASETESGTDATATITLNNNSKVIVNNHNGMGVGQASTTPEGYGIMNVNSGSTFQSTQNFLVTEKGTMNVNGGNVEVKGKVEVKGTLTSHGDIYGEITKASNDAVIEIYAGVYSYDPTAYVVNGLQAVYDDVTKLYTVIGTHTINIEAKPAECYGEQTVKVTVEVNGADFANAEWKLTYNKDVVKYVGYEDNTNGVDEVSPKVSEGIIEDKLYTHTAGDPFKGNTVLVTYEFETISQDFDDVKAVFTLSDAIVDTWYSSNFGDTEVDGDSAEVVVKRRDFENITISDTANGQTSDITNKIVAGVYEIPYDGFTHEFAVDTSAEDETINYVITKDGVVVTEILAKGTYEVEYTIEKTGYKPFNGSFKVVIGDPDFVLETSTYTLENYTLVMVYMNAEGMAPTFGGKQMYDITSSGYKYQANPTDEGTPYEFVYGIVIPEPEDSEDLTLKVAFNTADAIEIPSYDEDVNFVGGVTDRDAVVTINTYKGNKGQLEDYNLLSRVLKADVDKNKIVNMTDVTMVERAAAK